MKKRWIKVEWFELWTDAGERIAAFKYRDHAELVQMLALPLIGRCRIQPRWKNVEVDENE